jgi:hypothetical protein
VTRIVEFRYIRVAGLKRPSGFLRYTILRGTYRTVRNPTILKSEPPCQPPGSRGSGRRHQGM